MGERCDGDHISVRYQNKNAVKQPQGGAGEKKQSTKKGGKAERAKMPKKSVKKHCKTKEGYILTLGWCVGVWTVLRYLPSCSATTMCPLSFVPYDENT